MWTCLKVLVLGRRISASNLLSPMIHNCQGGLDSGLVQAGEETLIILQLGSCVLLLHLFDVDCQFYLLWRGEFSPPATPATASSTNQPRVSTSQPCWADWMAPETLYAFSMLTQRAQLAIWEIAAPILATCSSLRWCPHCCQGIASRARLEPKKGRVLALEASVACCEVHSKVAPAGRLLSVWQCDICHFPQGHHGW